MKLGQVVASALRSMANALDKERALAAQRHEEVMQGIGSILAGLPPLARRTEVLEEQVAHLMKPRPTNGKGTHA